MKTIEETTNTNINTTMNDQHNYTNNSVSKRKRTRRRRLLHHKLRPANSGEPSLSALSTSSSSTSFESTITITEQEEYMANCLIMLAQGTTINDLTQEDPSSTTFPRQKFKSQQFLEPASDTFAGGKAGFFVYECKTCNKSFTSFQALGGHRASHKKTKNFSAVDSGDVTTDEKKGLGCESSSIDVSNNNFNKKIGRVHGCSICGSEFSSGQALGGHMRRHRTLSVVESSSSSPEVMKTDVKSAFSLDLNLPAPVVDEEDRREDFAKSPVKSTTAVTFPASLIFSSSALVDCHY